jgi:arylsulfatase A-like enzyme
MTDVAPTLLDMLGLQVPESMEGQSFRALLRGNGAWRKETAFSEWYGEQGQTVYTVRRGRWKYVHNPAAVHPDGVPYCYHPGTSFPLERRELYDLESDPGETVNRADARPEVVLELEKELNRWLARRETPTPPAEGPDEETLEELKALGYLR